MCTWTCTHAHLMHMHRAHVTLHIYVTICHNDTCTCHMCTGNAQDLDHPPSDQAKATRHGS